MRQARSHLSSRPDKETDKEIVIKADIPGVDPKDVDISVNDGAIILRGEKKEEREDKKRNYHRVERFVGHSYRQVPLPQVWTPIRSPLPVPRELSP